MNFGELGIDVVRRLSTARSRVRVGGPLRLCVCTALVNGRLLAGIDGCGAQHLIPAHPQQPFCFGVCINDRAVFVLNDDTGSCHLG